ncbi:hypothetical protein D9M68_353600 [compost metagenome]
MREGGNRTAAAVGRQPRDRGAFQQERQQLRLLEDARHQLAIAQVVARQRRLVLLEHAVDGIHAVVRIADRLALAEQRLRHRFQAERRETPRGRAQRLDAIDDQPARRAGEIVLLRVVLAPFHLRAAAAEAQRQLAPPRMLDQHAQVELDQVPADDRIGVVMGQPLVQPLQQLRPCRAVFKREIDGGRFLRRSAEHIDLALAAAFERNRIQLAEGVGFDIERHQPQRGPVVRRGFQLGVAQHAVAVRFALKPHRRRDEALHQVALGRTDIGFIDVDAGVAQRAAELDQLPMLLAIQAHDGPAAEILQLQRAQFDLALAAQQRLGTLALCFGDECDRRLIRQAQPARPVVGGQPDLDLGAGRGIAPMSGQDETLLECHA